MVKSAHLGKGIKIDNAQMKCGMQHIFEIMCHIMCKRIFRFEL